MAWEDWISVDPKVRSGKPCIKGARITVYDVLEYLPGGMTESEIMRDFPHLKLEDIGTCLGLAAARERGLASSSARSSSSMQTSAPVSFSKGHLPRWFGCKLATRVLRRSQSC